MDFECFTQRPGLWHILDLIFVNLDYKSRLQCRAVSKSWKEFLEGCKYFWLPIFEKWLQYQWKFFKNSRLSRSWEQITLSMIDKSPHEIEVFGKQMNIYFSKNHLGLFEESPMHLAVVQGNVEFIGNLKVNLEILRETDSSGKDAMMLACIKNQEDIVQELIDVEPLMQSWMTAVDHFGKSALMFACERGFIGVVQKLLNSSNCTNHLMTKTKYGENALHLAVKGERVEIVKLLVEKLSTFRFLNATNKEGKTALHISVELRNESIVKFLLNCTNIDVNACDLNGRTPFLEACIRRSKKLMKILSKVSDVHFKDKEWRTALIWASSVGHIKVVKFLLKAKLMINECDIRNRTAIMYACMKGHIKIVKTLLADNASLRKVDFEGKSALTLAVENGHNDVAKLLLQSGKKLINDEETDFRLSIKFAFENGFDYKAKKMMQHQAQIRKRYNDGKTIFIWACENDFYQGVKAILAKNDEEYKVKIDDFDHSGMTGLMYACKNGNMELVKLLLDKKTKSVQMKDNSGKSAFFWAIYASKKDVVEYLLQKSEDYAKNANFFGHTALMLACQIGHCGIMKMILPYVADLNAKDNVGKTAFIHACENGHLDIVKCLWKKGKGQINFYLQDIYQKSALIYACENGYSSIIELIITKSTRVNFECKEEAFLWICYYGLDKVLEKLIHQEIDFNYTDLDGSTGLMWACHQRRIETVRLICENLDVMKIDLSIKDNNGNTAWMYAMGNKCITKLLEKAIENRDMQEENPPRKKAKLTSDCNQIPGTIEEDATADL